MKTAKGCCTSTSLRACAKNWQDAQMRLCGRDGDKRHCRKAVYSSPRPAEAPAATGRNFFIEHALDKILTEHVAGCWQTYNLKVARALAALVCTSEASIEAFITYGFEEAMAIIERHRGLVSAMARALIDHPERTLDGAEIDAVISQTLAREALAAEQARRAVWQHVTERVAI
jgi:transposase